MKREVGVHAKGPPPGTALLQLMAGLHVSRAIYVAARLGIADPLSDGLNSSEVLARATGLHALSLYTSWRPRAFGWHG